MNEYDVQDPYGTYNVGDELKPYEILNQMKSWNKEIRLTVSDVQTGLDGTIQKQSQILLDLDSIELSVVAIDGRLGTAESTIELHAGQIALKATQAQVDGVNARVTSAELLIDGLEAEILLKADASIVTAIGSRVTSAELEIDGLNAEILLKANSSTVSGMDTRLGTAELFISGVDAKIALKANSTVTDGIDTRLGNAELFISGVDAKINAKASSLITDGLNTRLGSAEFDIDGLQSEIALKATLVITDGLNTRVGTAETNISGMTSSINSKASTTVVDAIGTRVNTAEQNINGLNASISQKVSQTDYNGNTVWSMIAQNPYSIKLLASNIDLSGIVRVADSIELGLSTNGATKAIKFNGLTAWIYSDADNLNFDTSFIHMRAYTTFWQGVDFRNVPIVNHPFSLNGHTHSDYASSSHNHAGVYQPVGDYSVSGHSHGSSVVSPFTTQYLQLWRSGTKVRVYDVNARQYTELTGITGTY